MSYLSPVFNIINFGAVGDNATLNDAAINAAIGSLNSAGGGVLLIPDGIFRVADDLTPITVPCRIQGYGQGVSGVRTISDYADIFQLSTNSACHISGLRIDAAGVTTGFAIALYGTGSGVVNTGSIIEDCILQYCGTGIALSNTGETTIRSCMIWNNTCGIVYDNDASDGDANAGSVQGNEFNGNGIGIYQINNSSEIIIGNWFYNEVYHYYQSLPNPVTHGGNSNLKIIGNWMDAWGGEGGGAAICFYGPSASSTMTNVVICGNSFSAVSNTNLGGNAIEVLGGWVSDTMPFAWFGNFTITGNQFQFGNYASGDAIHLTNCIQGCISGNQFYNVGVYSGYAINIDSSCQSIVWAKDQLFYQTTVADSQTTVSSTYPITTVSVSSSTISLIGAGELFEISGGGAPTVSTINGGWGGRQVKILCTGTTTFSGGNIANATAYVVGAFGLANAVYDGVKWWLG